MKQFDMSRFGEKVPTNTDTQIDYTLKMQGKVEPVVKFQSGRVSCAVWRNIVGKDGDEYQILNSTFSIRYYDKKSKSWTDGTSYDKNSLADLRIVLGKAEEFVRSYHGGEE